MKKLRFNLIKYKEWLKEKEQQDNLTIDRVSFLNGYQFMDGMTYDYLWKQGLIVLKEWCD